MVATRRAGKKAPDAQDAPAQPTLNAPPKRGRKKAVDDEPRAAPAPKPTTKRAAAKATPIAATVEEKPAPKPTRTAKRKAEPEPEPEAAEMPPAKKATRGRKAVTIAEPPVVEEPAKPTRGRKAAAKKAPVEAAPVETTIEEPSAEEPVKSARTRKAPAKKASTKKAAAEEPVIEAPSAEEPVKSARGRKAPARKAPTKRALEEPVVEEPVAVEQAPVEEPAKATRARKAPAIAQVTAATRATRIRNVAEAPTESPLKAPARKPAKKAAAPKAITPKSQPVEMSLAEYPNYPNTPAHISAPITSRDAMAELPRYPNTPAHILAPISTKEALAEMPGYPKTPAHITAPLSNRKALAELANYPKTPAHIIAPMSSKEALGELPGYPKTPAHIKAPMTSKAALSELPDYPKTPAHIADSIDNSQAFTEMPVGYPNTPAHIKAPLSTKKAFNELPDYPKTPAHIAAPMTVSQGFKELPAEYPNTPGHIKAPVTVKEAFAELPEYPKTPAHIIAPVTTREALAELPNYPTTPAHIPFTEEAIQEALNTPVAERDSPIGLGDVSFEFATSTEYGYADLMEVDSDDISEIPDAISLAAEVARQSTPAPSIAAPNVFFAAPTFGSIAAPVFVSPNKSALRSPVKQLDSKTPKKTVTWHDDSDEETKDESQFLLHDGPLRGMTFFVDVMSNGKDQSFLFISLLEDLGAQVVREWTNTGLTHVLFKDGSKSTLEKVLATNGAVKCVNVGWVLDSEKNKTRMDENPYLVDLSSARPVSPVNTKPFKPYTPARTPSKYMLPPSSSEKSVPSTPTSSEFDRSINFDDKENSEIGIFFTDQSKLGMRTVPAKKTASFLFKSPIKTPSKSDFLQKTPLKPFSTSKKRSAEFGGLSMAPPKKLRLF